MGGPFGGHAVEQAVLFGHESLNRVGEPVSLTSSDIGVTTGVSGVDVSEWRLGNEGPQPGVVGGFFEERELFVADGQLGS